LDELIHSRDGRNDVFQRQSCSEAFRWVIRTWNTVKVKDPKPKYTAKESPTQGRREFSGRRRLSQDEVEAAFRNDTRFPPLLSLDQAARLSHFAPSTIKRLASEGFFRNSVRRGKPIAFWRDRFIVEVMELDNARKRNKHSKSENDRKENSTNETH
jgi:hypothetical protein